MFVLLNISDIPAALDTSRGDPAEEILIYAKLKEVDLIIMSTHGRSGVSRWAYGSVADKNEQHSVNPVLIAEAKGCRLNSLGYRHMNG